MSCKHHIYLERPDIDWCDWVKSKSQESVIKITRRKVKVQDIDVIMKQEIQFSYKRIQRNHKFEGNHLLETKMHWICQILMSSWIKKVYQWAGLIQALSSNLYWKTKINKSQITISSELLKNEKNLKNSIYWRPHPLLSKTHLMFKQRPETRTARTDWVNSDHQTDTKNPKGWHLMWTQRQERRLIKFRRMWLHTKWLLLVLHQRQVFAKTITWTNLKVIKSWIPWATTWMKICKSQATYRVQLS